MEVHIFPWQADNTDDWVVVSSILYFHPYLGKIPILTNIFQMGWNHQLDDVEDEHPIESQQINSTKQINQ